MLIGLAERGLRRVQLGLPSGQVRDDALEIGVDTRELRVHGVQARRAAGVRGQRRARRGLAVDRVPERPLGVGLVGLHRAEPELRVGERPRRGRPHVGAAEHVGVERVQARTGLMPEREPLVPPSAAPLAFREQPTQARGRELLRQLLRLVRQGLVLLGHLRLLAQRLQLPLQLGQDVLEPEQILIEARELPLGPLLALAVLRDPRGLLDVLPPLLRTGQQHLLQLSLPDDGVKGTPDPGLGEELLHVEEADDLAVDPILALPERKIERLTSISVIGTGIRPASLSITSLTSAIPSAGRLGVPAKITSAICPPRSARGLARRAPS